MVLFPSYRNNSLFFADHTVYSTKLSLLRENDLVTSIQSYSKPCFGSYTNDES